MEIAEIFENSGRKVSETQSITSIDQVCRYQVETKQTIRKHVLCVVWDTCTTGIVYSWHQNVRIRGYTLDSPHLLSLLKPIYRLGLWATSFLDFSLIPRCGIMSRPWHTAWASNKYRTEATPIQRTTTKIVKSPRHIHNIDLFMPSVDVVQEC